MHFGIPFKFLIIFKIDEWQTSERRDKQGNRDESKDRGHNWKSVRSWTHSFHLIYCDVTKREREKEREVLQDSFTHWDEGNWADPYRQRMISRYLSIIAKYIIRKLTVPFLCFRLFLSTESYSDSNSIKNYRVICDHLTRKLWALQLRYNEDLHWNALENSQLINKMNMPAWQNMYYIDQL